MKLLKLGLRTFITFGSVASFMLGWVLLGNSPKPVQSAKPNPSTSTNSTINIPSLPTLEPLPAVDQAGVDNSQPSQPFVVQQQVQQPVFPAFNQPFVTAGS